MSRSTKRGTLALALVAALVAAFALAAATSANTATGGKTTLKLDPDTAEGLADMSIGVQATGAGKDGKHGFSWPVKGGDIVDAQTGPLGSLEHKGGLAFFTEGGPSVKFTQFRIQFGKSKVKLFAKTGHSEARFLDLDTSKADVTGSETALKIKGAKATLAKDGAKVLSDTFDFPFKKGIEMGSATIKATLAKG